MSYTLTNTQPRSHTTIIIISLIVSARTGLPPVMDFIRRRRLSVFSHIAQLTQGAPAHKALHCQVGLASGQVVQFVGTGDIVLVVLALAGQSRQTNSVTTLDLSLPTSGDRPFYGAMAWRDGPSWLYTRWRRRRRRRCSDVVDLVIINTGQRFEAPRAPRTKTQCVTWQNMFQLRGGNFSLGTTWPHLNLPYVEGSGWLRLLRLSSDNFWLRDISKC